MANILFGEADTISELNTSWHRCRVPAQILNERGHHCIVTHITNLIPEHPDPKIQEAIKGADVIVLERLLVSDIHPRIKEWKEIGKRVISTFDDAYHLLPDSGGVPKRTWRGGKKIVSGHNADGSEKLGAILNQFREGLRLVDTALVPSKVLLEDYKLFCPTIQFVPNILHPDLWKDLKRRPLDNNFMILWGGSSAHDISWRDSGLPQALGIICKRYPRVHLHIQSRDPRILILLDKANLQGRYTSAMWIPFQSWPGVVVQGDLYVMPLAGSYDLRRSSLKQVEAGMAKIPWVASNLAPYQGGVGGILVENRVTDWVNAISTLIEDKELRDKMSEEGHNSAMVLYNGAGEMYEKSLSI